MINCIILEDEELAAKSLIKIISKIDELNLLGHYYNPLEAQRVVDFGDVDLIFLDVEMPEISGLDFIKSLSNPPRVIVNTSNSNFALGAFEIDAIDFVLKPVTLSNVLKALSKYQEIEGTDEVEPINSKVESIFVKVDSTLIQLTLQDIAWVEALGDYVGFHVNGKRYVVKATLSSIEKRIQNIRFVRVHRSYMVNTRHIKSIDDSSLVIGDKLIPISRGNRAQLMDRLHLLK